MISKQTALRIPLAGLACLAALYLAGCTSMPLTSMYKLSRMDPMEADPAQIKVAVRADEAIGIGKGDAQIEFKFDAEDNSLNIDEIYLIEVVRDPVVYGALYADKKPGESITVLALTPSDAERMKQLQLEMAQFRNRDVKGSGSLRVNLNGLCLHSKMPPGEVQLDLFLQTSEQEGFFVMAKNLDMREVMAEEGTEMDELPGCAG
jgi:hypothetical protein